MKRVREKVWRTRRMVEPEKLEQAAWKMSFHVDAFCACYIYVSMMNRCCNWNIFDVYVHSFLPERERERHNKSTHTQTHNQHIHIRAYNRKYMEKLIKAALEEWGKESNGLKLKMKKKEKIIECAWEFQHHSKIVCFLCRHIVIFVFYLFGLFEVLFQWIYMYVSMRERERERKRLSSPDEWMGWLEWIESTIVFFLRQLKITEC